ncbi:MAG TPA: ATPase domain-containing protein [Ktedonobacterales bacterium]
MPQDDNTEAATSDTANVLATGVSNLDQLLAGGLPRNAFVLIMGRPGSGKTTLANQIAFHAARSGKRVLILTALSESTSKLIAHLRSFDFFDQSLIGGPIQFLSLQPLLDQGLEAAGREILSMARRMSADMVVLDGFRGMRGIEGAPLLARQFLYDVGTTLSTMGSMFLVTTETEPTDPTFYPETTTADVIIALHYNVVDVAQRRTLEVIKARGRAPLPGLHSLALSSKGAIIYPQFEVRVIQELLDQRHRLDEHIPVNTVAPSERASSVGTSTVDVSETSDGQDYAPFGLPELDHLMNGGLTRATSTLVAGSSGTGKTLLALNFAVAGVRAGEPTLYVGLREGLDQILAKADAFNLGRDLRQALLPGGGLTLLRIPPIQLNPDVVADRLLGELDRIGAKRLIVDSIYELERAIRTSEHPRRLDDYLAALLEALHARRVTALFTRETEKALAASLDFSGEPLSVLAENVILLQQVVFRQELYRLLSVLKMRMSPHDNTLREFRIVSPSGITVLESVQSASGVLEGIAEQEGGGNTAPGMDGQSGSASIRAANNDGRAGAERRGVKRGEGR